MSQRGIERWERERDKRRIERWESGQIYGGGCQWAASPEDRSADGAHGCRHLVISQESWEGHDIRTQYRDFKYLKIEETKHHLTMNTSM